MKYFTLVLISLFSLSSIRAQQTLLDEDFGSFTDSVSLPGWTNNDLDTSASNGIQLWWFGYNPRNYDLNAPIDDTAAIFDQQEYLFDAVVVDVALESPSFDASSPGTITLSFDHHFESGGFGSSYAVEVYDGTAWDTATSGSSSTSPNPPSGTYTTTSASFNISTLTGGATNAQIRFRYSAPVFAGVYWILDNVKIEQSSCAPPSNLSASNITTNSATLSWTSGSGSDWNLEYGPTGFSLGTGTQINTTTASTNLSGLSPNTIYDYYVRDSCGPGQLSSWTGPYSFSTACTPFSAPYTQNFDGVSQPNIPDCWFSLVETPNNVPFASTFGVGSNYSSSPNAIVFYNQNATAPQDFIAVISPEFSDLQAQDKQLRFQAQTADGSSLIVGTMADPTDSSSFVAAGIVPGGQSSFAQFTIPLVNVPAGHSYVAFQHGKGNSSDYIYLDDFNYEVIPCQASAGTGATGTVCASDTAVNLNNYLTGADTGGSYLDLDNTGALSDSLFDASAVAPNASFHFAYVVSQPGCPDDSAQITINVEDLARAGSNAQDTVCDTLGPLDLNNYLGASAQSGGSWNDLHNTGALIGSNFNLGQVAPNSLYQFEYLVSGTACPNDTALIAIYVDSCSSPMSLQEHSSPALRIYPNPSPGILHLEQEPLQTGKSSVHLLSVEGKLLRSRNFKGRAQLEWDLSELPQGAYFLKFISDQGVQMQRILLQ